MSNKSAIKWVFDRFGALALVFFSLPLFVLFSLALKFSSIGAIFFVHQRPGLNGKPFFLYKFKTMNDAKDSEGNLLPNRDRITSFGRFLRSYSLDEIPQLINVLRGELSLVGPRPLEMRYLPYYTEKQNRRHEVKPGITGWAQVNGRNAIGWEQKFELDVWYVDNQSLFLDIKILFLTIKKVIISEGVNVNQSLTVEPFDVYVKKQKDAI